MIKLHQFPPVWGLPNASPFCMKLETYLRMAQLPYVRVAASPRGAPTGKLPYIEDGNQIVGDSSLAIEHLIRRYGDTLDQHLNDNERATALAFRRLLEEHLYWVLVYSRWVVAENWPQVRQAFFGGLPMPLRLIVPPLVRLQTRRALYLQGIGRHSSNEIFSMGINDISAVSDFLGGNSFFLGSRPSSIDATVYAFIANIILAPVESPLKRHALRLQNLQSYCAQMRRRFYLTDNLPPEPAKPFSP